MAADIEFRAPWSTQLRTATVLSVVMLLIVLAAMVAAGRQMQPLARGALIALPLLLIAGTAACTVRGYVLTEHAILVRRLGWTTRLPLAGIESITGDAQAMSGSIRLAGNGGLFSFSGEFWNRKLRRYRALATDPSRAVVLRYPRRTIVITPHDPQQFIVRARTALKFSDGTW